MCGFFSLVSNGHGTISYFNSEIRKKIINKELDYESTDSHTSICHYYKLKEDKMNKWEYNPFTKELVEDQINANDNDFGLVRKKCDELDFKTIVPELIIKPIINPLEVEWKLTDEVIQLAIEWSNALYQVRDQVRDQVRNQVGHQVWDQVRDQVWEQVGHQVGHQVWYQVWEQVWYQVWEQVWDQVRDQVYSYVGTFFDISWTFNGEPVSEYPYQSGAKLWELGFVITKYDGNINLHAGKNMEIVHKIKLDSNNG